MKLKNGAFVCFSRFRDNAKRLAKLYEVLHFDLSEVQFLSITFCKNLTFLRICEELSVKNHLYLYLICVRVCLPYYIFFSSSKKER